jgi:hypothetical protein
MIKLNVKIIILVVIFLAVFVADLVNAAPIKSRYEREESAITKMEQAGKEALETDVTVRRKEVQYKAQDLRDPFESFLQPKEVETNTQNKQEVPLPELVIQGITWGGNFPQAIINNKVVKVGDQIEGVRVVKIDREGIEVNFNNRQYSIPSPVGSGAKASKQNPGGG